VFEARCAADNRFGLRPLAEVEHRNPSLGCGCGIHASASPRDLMTSTPSLPALSVVGTVSMWGHTIEHQRAWRSQFAYPARLTLVCAECLRSGAGGGRPVAVALGVYGRSTRESLVAMCDAHRRLAAGGSFPMIDVAEVQGALLDRYAVDPLPQEAVRMLVARRLDAGSVPSLQPRVGPSSAGTHPASALPSSVVPAAPATPAPAPAATAPIATAPAKDPLWVHVARGAWDVVSFCFGLAFVVTMSIVSLQSCIVTVPAGGDDAGTAPRICRGGDRRHQATLGVGTPGASGAAPAPRAGLRAPARSVDRDRRVFAPRPVDGARALPGRPVYG
jgi:hypothetical protein